MAHAISLPEDLEVIRVLAADSTRMNSQLLAAALEREKRFEVLPPVSSAQGIIAAVVKEKPGVVVISAELEEDPRQGFAVAAELRALSPETRVVMLLDVSDPNLVVEAFRTGARGVFCRSESLKTLAKCISCVYQGQIWASSKELRFLLEALSHALPLRMMDARGTALLSRREQEVVRCVAEGLSNREIAQRLGLTEHTVKNYLFRIFDKLGVSKRVEVVLYAYSLGDTIMPGNGLGSPDRPSSKALRPGTSKVANVARLSATPVVEPSPRPRQQ